MFTAKQLCELVFTAGVHLVGQLVGQDELAGMELVQQKHLNALRTCALQCFTPQRATARSRRMKRGGIQMNYTEPG